MKLPRVEPEALRRFAQDLLCAAGAERAEAQVLAEILVWCDCIGRPAQGVWRLPILTRRLTNGVIKSPCRPIFEQRAGAVGILDGDGGIGHYVAQYAMGKAIELARLEGIGAVAVRNSNFLGACAYYVEQAAKEDMVGLAFSNSFPKVAAHGGTKPVLGTNPLAFSAPRQNGHSILLDMATSAVAGSTVRMSGEQGLELPEGWAVGHTGDATVEPQGIPQNVLSSFGGAKGFGLALMVELLCGVVSGAGIGKGVRSMYEDFTASGDNGHFMLAIDISRFMDFKEYCQRVEWLIQQVKASTSETSGTVVRIPGESRWQALHEATVRGVELETRTRAALDVLARNYLVERPW